MSKKRSKKVAPLTVKNPGRTLMEPTCLGCGEVYPESELRAPCPNCGGTRRKFYQHNQGRLSFSTDLCSPDQPVVTELRAVKRSRGFSRTWKMIELIKRLKRGGISGLPTREELRFDRTAPDKTIKTHHVEELQPDGTWKVEHTERKEYPAKKRPWLKK